MVIDMEKREYVKVKLYIENSQGQYDQLIKAVKPLLEDNYKDGYEANEAKLRLALATGLVICIAPMKRVDSIAG